MPEKGLIPKTSTVAVVSPGESPNTLTSNASLGSSWMPYKGLAIHEELFARGMVVAQPLVEAHQDDIAKRVTHDNFFIQNRTFTVQSVQSDKSQSTLSKRQLDSAKPTYKLLNTLLAFRADAAECSSVTTGVAICNKTRREEIFIPLTVTTTTKKAEDTKHQLGFYVYPWVSGGKKTTKDLEFKGIEQFVTAGCMFGTGLKAGDQHGELTPIIKHNIDFFDGERFESILYDIRKTNPYEAVLFDEFKRQTWIIKRFAVAQDNIPLLHHLPYYDYILFGVQLFINDRISFNALSVFFKHIFQKKAEQTRKIKKICQQQGINVTVASPFDALFGEDVEKLEQQLLSLLQDDNVVKHLSESEIREQVVRIQEEITMAILIALRLDKENQNVADSKEQDPTQLFEQLKEKDRELSSLLSALEVEEEPGGARGIVRQEVNQLIRRILNLPSEKSKANEHALVQGCLNKLQADDNKVSGQIWKDFLKTKDQNSITDFEGLYHLANASIIAQAASGKPHNTTCSILPVSEKTIQVEYSKKSYPGVLCLTLMESVIPYTSGNKGSLFYCADLIGLPELITHRRILESAHVNVCRQSTGEKPIALEEALKANKGSPATNGLFVSKDRPTATAGIILPSTQPSPSFTP